MTKYVITKRIAKHGKHAVIVVPKVLQDKIPAGTVVQLTIDVLEESQ